MNKRTKLIMAPVAAAAAIAIGAGVGAAAGGDDRPLHGRAYDQATTAALEHVGGGTVTETEVAHGQAAYEVGIRLDDGSEVEVQLNDNFAVIDSQTDEEGSNDVD